MDENFRPRFFHIEGRLLFKIEIVSVCKVDIDPINGAGV